MTKENIIRTASVFLIQQNSKVCLAVKKCRIGAGFLMAYGGHLEEKESPETCAVRELLQEAGVKTWPQDLEKVAILRCHNVTKAGKRFICIVHVFLTRFWLSDPKESDEMGRPEWHKPDALPFLRIMLADRDWLYTWLPKLISGKKKIIVTIWHGPNQETLERPVQVEEVDKLPDE